MNALVRLLKWVVLIGLAAGVVLLLVVMFWMPPNDPDSFALVRERTEHKSDYRLGKTLPGMPDQTHLLNQRLAAAGFKLGSPIFIRIYKLSFELEVWMQKGPQFALFATYPICNFSGQLGPKIKFGDWQSPEGIYYVDRSLLNPYSRHHRAFNLGFPNAFDRSLGRTGSLLEVHGGCGSIGCFAMTDPGIDDIYKLVDAALAGGQPRFQVEVLPFQMTEKSFEAHAKHTQAPFWQDLKYISDKFDETHRPPDVAVCSGHYRLAKSTEPDCRPL